MMVVRRRKRRMVMMMTVVVLRMMMVMMMMLQPVPYHVHLYAGDSSDSEGWGGGWGGGGVRGFGGGVCEVCLYTYVCMKGVCVCARAIMSRCVYVCI